MSEDVRVTNFPSSGSPEAVALEIWKYLRNGKASVDDQLKFYTRCITAVTARDGSFHDLLRE